MSKTKMQALSEMCIKHFKREFARWNKSMSYSWRTTSGSGNQSHDEGDLELLIDDDKSILVEHKATEKKQYALKLATLRKVQQEAWRMGSPPALVISFRNAETHSTDHFVVLQLEDWEFRHEA